MTTFSDLVSQMNTTLERRNLLQSPSFLTLNFPHLLPPPGQTTSAILRSTSRWHTQEAKRYRHMASQASPSEAGSLFKRLKYHVKMAETLLESAHELEMSGSWDELFV